MTPEQFMGAAGVSPSIATTWAGPMTAAMAEFNINTPARQAMFLAQVLHESAMLTKLTEDLHYRADRLLAMWPTRFGHGLAAQYGRNAQHDANPEMIANIAYADRMGNGDPASGDGWKYRGRGPLQATGYAMCEWLDHRLGADLVNNPGQLAGDPVIGARAAAAIFSIEKGCLPYADRGDVVSVSGLINAGHVVPPAQINGLAERADLYKRLLGALGA